MPFSFPSNPTVGQYSRQNNRVYKWNGYSWDLFYNNLSILALVVGGGGAGGGGVGSASQSFGGGGGGGAVIEEYLTINLDTAYGVTIGSGGVASSVNGTRSTGGSSSRFGGVYASGGGSGGMNNSNGAVAPLLRQGYPGAASGAAGSGTGISYPSVGPGFNAGTSGSSGFTGCGGGGGAGAAGSNSSGNSGGAGGAGKQSIINNLFYGGGGGGVTNAGTGIAAGGSGVGGSGGNSNTNSTPGTANTGGGGGGCYQDSNGHGGSGVVILRFDATLTITLSAGLTYSVSFVGNEEIVTITQGTGTVTFTV